MKKKIKDDDQFAVIVYFSVDVLTYSLLRHFSYINEPSNSIIFKL